MIGKSVRKLLAVSVATAILGASMTSTARALDLSGTYSDILKNTTSPKVVAGQERGYLTLGSIYYRTPSSTSQPLSITPPSIHAGCSGIDFTFGALSYLDLNQIVAWLKQVLQAAPGVAFEIAMQKFLPGVTNKLNELTALSQKVNSMGLDSCEASHKIVETMWGLGAKMTTAEKNKAVNENAKTGNAQDFFSSITQSLNDFASSLHSWLSTSEGKKYKEEVKDIEGDIIYNEFKQKYGGSFELNSWAKEEFLLTASLLGDSCLLRVKPQSGKSFDEQKLWNVTYVPSVLTVDDLLHAKSRNGYVYDTTTVQDSFGHTFTAVTTSKKTDIYTEMENLCSQVPAGYQNYCKEDVGFAGVVRAYMYDILNKIENHQPLQQQEKDFVGATPLPILKWLNTLAYFPGVGENFIESSKDYIATFYVEALLREGLRGISSLPWTEVPEDLKRDIQSIYKNAVQHYADLYKIRQKTVLPIKTFNQFADFVNHYEKAVVTDLASKQIYNNL